MTFADELRVLEACPEAVEWVGAKTLAEAWVECKRGDWMLWLLQRTKIGERISVTIAVRFAERVAHLTDVPQARSALDSARGWLAGTVSKEGCRRTAYADAAAASASAAVSAAAYAAAAAAERTAQAVIIREHVSAAAASAAAAERTAQAVIIREHVSAADIVRLWEAR